MFRFHPFSFFPFGFYPLELSYILLRFGNTFAVLKLRTKEILTIKRGSEKRKKPSISELDDFIFQIQIYPISVLQLNTLIESLGKQIHVIIQIF